MRRGAERGGAGRKEVRKRSFAYSVPEVPGRLVLGSGRGLSRGGATGALSAITESYHSVYVDDSDYG